MTASVIYPLKPLGTSVESSTPDAASVFFPNHATAHTSNSSDLHLREGMVAPDGRGTFQTLASIKVKPTKASKKAEAYQWRKCQEHLLHLQRRNSLASHRPSSSDTRLAAMFVDMLRPDSPKHQLLLILGNWVSSIPARIGSSSVATLAAELFIHSSNAYRDNSHSSQTLALRTKSKALKELQLSVLASPQYPTYDLVIAMKLHSAAEVMTHDCDHCPSTDIGSSFSVGTTSIIPSTRLV